MLKIKGKRVTTQMFHKEEKLLGKAQADGLDAKQEGVWMERWW